MLMVDFCQRFTREKDVCQVAREAVEVLRTQAAASRDWQSSNDPDIVDAFPAMAVVVVMQDREPAGWQTRWTEAGGRIVDGRALALRDDLVWRRFSSYGHPFPPFDWLEGLGVEDVDRNEAEAAGLLTAAKRTTQPAGPSGCLAVVIVLAAVGATGVGLALWA